MHGTALSVERLGAVHLDVPRRRTRTNIASVDRRMGDAPCQMGADLCFRLRRLDPVSQPQLRRCGRYAGDHPRPAAGGPGTLPVVWWLVIFALWALHYLNYRYAALQRAVFLHPLGVAALTAVEAAAIVLLLPQVTAPFIYFQF